MTIYCTRSIVYYFLHIKYTLHSKIHYYVWSKTSLIYSCVGGAAETLHYFQKGKAFLMPLALNQNMVTSAPPIQ